MRFLRRRPTVSATAHIAWLPCRDGRGNRAVLGVSISHHGEIMITSPAGDIAVFEQPLAVGPVREALRTAVLRTVPAEATPSGPNGVVDREPAPTR